MAYEKTLKTSPTRTVVLRAPGADAPRGGGDAEVVKRFRARGLLGPWRARVRAHREFALLTALHGAGVRVPRPHALVRARGGWEVRMEWIRGARSLRHVLARGEAPESLLAALGGLLARAHAAGLDHPDLHLGNLLVDEDGAPWLVDLHAARRRRSLPPVRIAHDLLVAAAALREHLDAPARARLFRAWWRAAPRELRATLGAPPAVAERLEREARAHRRAVVERGARRWTRTSGRCARERTREGWTVRRRWDVPSPGDAWTRVHRLDGRDPGSPAVRWTTAARLVEHGLPAALPERLVDGPDAHATFLVPAPGDAAPSPRELGRLLGLLHDRGLDVPALGPGGVAGAGDEPVLLPPLALSAFDPRPGGVPAGRRFRAVDPAVAGTTEFRAGYVDAFAAWPRERAQLARELGGAAPDQ